MAGTLTGVAGTVEVMKRGATDWVQATNDMKISSGDQLNTGIDGKATLNFENTVTDVKPLTQFTVGRAMESDKEYTTEMFLSVGKLVTKADKNSGKLNKFSVTTPSAVAGIRGTTQEIGYGAGFGTECHIEDGVGAMTPVSPDKLPPAVQMCLGVGPAVEAAAGGGEAKGAEGGAGAPGTGGGPGSEAAPGAGAGEGQSAAANVADALDQWLGATFDKEVEAEPGAAAGAEEKSAGGEEKSAPGQEESPGAGPEVSGGDDPTALLEAASSAGEEIQIEDGQDASVSSDPTDLEAVVTPTENLVIEAVTDIAPAGAPDAVVEANTLSTDVVDEPVSESAVDASTSDEATQQLIDDISDGSSEEGAGSGGGSGSSEEEDLFGQPPSKPD